MGLQRSLTMFYILISFYPNFPHKSGTSKCDSTRLSFITISVQHRSQWHRQLYIYRETCTIPSICRWPSYLPSMFRSNLRASAILQSTVNKLQQWSDKSGFQLSAEKSAAVHFCRRRGCERHLHITLNNNAAKRTDKTKYLGIILDNTMSWKYRLWWTILLWANSLNFTWKRLYTAIWNLYGFTWVNVVFFLM